MIILLLLMFFENSDAVLYKLNDSQYALMPPVMHLDSYEACQLDSEALYCTAEFVLVSDQPSPLLDMIKEYSDHYTTHYNHTNLRYGICVTQTCKTFYEQKTWDPMWTLEACLNESLTNKYGLKVKALEEYSCHTPGKSEKDIDRLDIIVGAVCILFLVLNVVGSFYDNGTKYENIKVNTFLLHFSLRRNWNKLVTPTAEGRDPRLERLKCFDGLRTIMIFYVIIIHSFIINVLVPNNTRFIEYAYTIKACYPFHNSAISMQLFFMISAFLLVYLLLLDSEKHPVTWSMLPKRIFKRWLRLTPSYAFVIALTATWLGHLASGPLWNKYVGTEMSDCRQYWWQNILYMHHFFSTSECIAQSWYLGAEMQLHCLALIVYLACRTNRSRFITLSLLFVIGSIIPGVIIYLQDLDGIMMLSPEPTIQLFIHDPHFMSVYNRSYCNISGYVAGMALAYLTYYWQKHGLDLKKYQTFAYRVMYWCLLLLVLLGFCSSSPFYFDVPRPSIYIRTAYATFSKSIFNILVVLFILGILFKFEGRFRGLLEWRGWAIPSKLSYSMYLLHMTIVRNFIASHTQNVQHGLIYMIGLSLVVLLASFVVSFFYWMLVEAPLNNIVDDCLSKPKQERKEKIG